MASSPEPVNVLDQRVLLILSQETLLTLSAHITSASGGYCRGRTWEGFAGRIGCNTEQVTLLREHRHSDKGWLVLSTWDRLEKNGATVKKLIIALESLKMRICIHDLEEGTSITAEDIELALNECAELTATGKLDSLFPRFSTAQFNMALNHTDQDRLPHASLPPYGQPYQYAPHHREPERVVGEDLAQTADDVHCDLLENKPLSEKEKVETVFISYCPCSGEADQTQTNRLKELTQTLREYGYIVYCEMDCLTEIRNCGGLDLWKEKHIRQSDNVLVVCTPEYFQEDEYVVMEKKHSKIEVDSRLLRKIAYSNESNRLMAIQMDEYKNERDCVPQFAQAMTLHYWPSQKEDFLFCLARMAKHQLPEIREKKVLKPITIRIPQTKTPKSHQPPPTQTRERKTVERSTPPTQERKKVLQSTVVNVPQQKKVTKTEHKSCDVKKGQKRFGFSSLLKRTNKKSKK